MRFGFVPRPKAGLTKWGVGLWSSRNCIHEQQSQNKKCNSLCVINYQIERVVGVRCVEHATHNSRRHNRMAVCINNHSAFTVRRERCQSNSLHRFFRTFRNTYVFLPMASAQSSTQESHPEIHITDMHDVEEEHSFARTSFDFISHYAHVRDCSFLNLAKPTLRISPTFRLTHTIRGPSNIFW